MKHVMYQDAGKKWRWRFISSNGKIIAVSSESYSRKPDCERSIELMKDSADAPFNEEKEG